MRRDTSEVRPEVAIGTTGIRGEIRAVVRRESTKTIPITEMTTDVRTDDVNDEDGEAEVEAEAANIDEIKKPRVAHPTDEFDMGSVQKSENLIF